MYQDHSAPVPECQCFPVPEEYWTTHYGAVDPATMFEPNPACPEHFPENFAEDGSPFPPFPVTQEFTPQGDSGRFDPEPPLSAEEVLASCDHSRFGTVTRRSSFLWISCCSGCGTVLGPAPRPQDAEETVRRDLERKLSDWADRAEDYLAQENPPLPPIPVDEDVLKNEILFVQNDDVVFTVRVDLSAEERAKKALREYLGTEIYSCTRDHSAWSHGTMGLDDFTLAAEDEDIVDSLYTIVLDAMNGGRR